MGVLLIKFSRETSVPSGFLTVTLAADRGINAREPASTGSRLLPGRAVGVDGVDGGDVKSRLFVGCARVGGWGAWTGEAMACDRVGVAGPWRVEGGFRGDMGISV